jgi:phage head maturation protease
LIIGITRVDIRTSSFSFYVATNGEKWECRDSGVPLRTVSKFSVIYDVSAVYREAYADASVALRNLKKFKTAVTVAPVPEKRKMTPKEERLRQTQRYFKLKK